MSSLLLILSSTPFNSHSACTHGGGYRHVHNVEPLWFPSLHVNNAVLPPLPHLRRANHCSVSGHQPCVFGVHDVLIADYMNNGGISWQIIRCASQGTKLLIKCGAPHVVGWLFPPFIVRTHRREEKKKNQSARREVDQSQNRPLGFEASFPCWSCFN